MSACSSYFNDYLSIWGRGVFICLNYVILYLLCLLLSGALLLDFMVSSFNPLGGKRQAKNSHIEREPHKLGTCVEEVNQTCGMQPNLVCCN